jgi:choline dehydrogenase
MKNLKASSLSNDFNAGKVYRCEFLRMVATLMIVAQATLFLSAAHAQTTSSEEYDYVVIGSDSAGCAIAARFLEYAANNLLILEADPTIQTDEEIKAYINKYIQTIYHPVGTCKMGNDEMAVVDHELRVHGIDGLRVADASIMPTIINANTNAPTIMIGEKCADLIRRA